MSEEEPHYVFPSGETFDDCMKRMPIVSVQPDKTYSIFRKYFEGKDLIELGVINGVNLFLTDYLQKLDNHPTYVITFDISKQSLITFLLENFKSV